MSLPQKIDPSLDIVGNAGEITIQELHSSTVKFSAGISGYFSDNPSKNGVFIAFLSTKNETSEIIPTNIFDKGLTRELNKSSIYTVKVEKREEILSEFKFSRSGLTKNTLAMGQLRSPNFFIECVINEQSFKHGNKPIVEQVINIELIEVKTSLVVWSDSVSYRKKTLVSPTVSW